MKIAFLTLGCKLNYAETSTYQRGFEQAGLEVVPWQQAADIYLINTCSVTATSDSKSRNLIRKVHRINPAARIVVTGCSAQLRRAEIESIDGVWRVFGSAEKSQVVPETLSRLSATAKAGMERSGIGRPGAAGDGTGAEPLSTGPRKEGTLVVSKMGGTKPGRTEWPPARPEKALRVTVSSLSGLPRTSTPSIFPSEKRYFRKGSESIAAISLRAASTTSGCGT